MLESYVAVDLEMTGLNARTDRILEIGAVKVENHQVTEHYQKIINPRRRIPKEVQELTGITDELAGQGAEESQVLEEFFQFCGNEILVGHNLIFDYSFLKQYAVNHKMEFEREGVDTLRLSRKFLPELEKKTLDALCIQFQIHRDKSHRALEDARAAAVLLERLMEEYGEKDPSAFRPVPLIYKAKKQGPAMPRQKRYLKELLEYHKIDSDVEIESLTKSEASRMTDQILRTYGKITAGQEEKIFRETPGTNKE